MAFDDLYGREFFSAQEESYESATHTWPLVTATLGFPVRSVIDFGCGPGAWLAAFRDLNPGATILGVDHPGAGSYDLMIKADEFVEADLSNRVSLDRAFDLCVSLEVAEHLREAGAERFVAMLTKHSDTVLFSAAIPMQQGTGHINCQWPSYWIERFAAHGFRCFDRVRPQIWSNKAIGLHYRQNALLFSKRSIGESGPDWGGADLVHPEMYERFWPRRVPRTPRNLIRLIRGTLRF